MQKRAVDGGKALKLLGARVRELRKAADWSQEELAERCGLHPIYIGYVERAERSVNVIVIFQLAGALGVEPAELFAGITVDDVKNLPARG